MTVSALSSKSWPKHSVEDASLFEREHHRRIASVLEALDANALATHRCYFGGGTAIALKYGEYRDSVDIGFMVSDKDGYRALRLLATGPPGIQALARPGAVLAHSREVRADQYGIRTAVTAFDVAIKLAIVLEARITFDTPGPDDVLCGITALSPLDMVAGKLLANSDRWADGAVFQRDVIDLAMMAPSKKLLADAMAKATGAYGDSIARDLGNVILYLKDNPLRLDQCMQAMGMRKTPKALLWQRIRKLGELAGLPIART